jgi:hypothetical protein
MASATKRVKGKRVYWAGRFRDAQGVERTKL